MRYFVGRKNGVVVEKRAVAGDNDKIDALAADYATTHPNLAITEVDQVTFDTTAMVPPPTPEQQAWAAFKATNPSAQQGILYLAKQIGLE